MIIQTQYSHEKIWTDTTETDLLKMIEEELGDEDSKGVLLYIKETIVNGKVISVGTCKFRKKGGK